MSPSQVQQMLQNATPEQIQQIIQTTPLKKRIAPYETIYEGEPQKDESLKEPQEEQLSEIHQFFCVIFLSTVVR